jgi:hypothetical protein
MSIPPSPNGDQREHHVSPTEWLGNPECMLRAADFADDLRRKGGKVTELPRLLTEAGFGQKEMESAIQHFAAACPHEGGGNIGDLPTYPAHRFPLDGTADRDIRAIADAGWAAIAQANDPPQFFDYGGTAVWVKTASTDVADVETITAPRMTHLLGEVGSWTRQTQSGTKPCRPPRAVADHMVSDPRRRLPRLRRLVRFPVFDSSGHLVVRPGFHADSGLFLAPRGLALPPIAHGPTRGDVERSKTLIYESVEDFPFVDEADRTNAMAFGFLPYLRDVIPGPTPLHLFTKPYPGSGATLLVQALYYPALGRRAAMQSVPTSEVEAEYRMTATLLASPAIVVFDNIRETLDSGQLATAFTASTWEGRQIKTSTLLTLPINNSWAATGNNVKVSDEIARRTIPIRLDPHTDRPFDRTGFRHPNLVAWERERRSDLVSAYLTLGQAWVAEGMPSGPLVVGMFEDWATVMSGVAEVVGLPHLRGNWDEWNQSRPSDQNELRKVVAAWRAEFGERELKVGNLLPIIGPPCGIDPEAGRASETALGIRLRAWEGRVADGYEIVGRQVSGSTSWRLALRG